MKKDDGKRKYESEIPTDAIEALARTLYPAMVAYFKSEEGQRKFASIVKPASRSAVKII